MLKRKINIAASLICANPLQILNDVKELQDANVEFIHFDVMDGSFVPRYGLYPEILVELKKITKIPVDVHMMVNNPEDFIDTFKTAGADFYNFHIESTLHAHRIIQKIKKAGMKPGIAINPATPISALEYIINDIEMVVLMAINPGIVGHKLIPNIINKIKDLRDFSNKHNHPNLYIEIDGGVTPESAMDMILAGADTLVCGTGTIFRPHEDTIFNKIKQFRKIIN